MTRILYRNTILYLTILSCACLIAFACKKQSIPMVITSSDPMVQEFYTTNKKTLFWVSSKKSIKKAKEWLVTLDSAKHFGIDAEFEKIAQVRTSLLNTKKNSSLQNDETDQQITALVLNFIKELQEGKVQFDYDEVKVSRDSVYVNLLLNARTSVSAQKMVTRLNCKDHEYQVLEKFLNNSITTTDSLKYQLVITAMNYRRYISMNHQQEFILVNIPETLLRYYRDNSLIIEMRTVVGRKRSPTPTIASYITNIVTFPHWNVPHSIAVKEILPKVQKDEIYLEQSNLYVVYATGDTVDESELFWDDYTEKNFPYYFRQSTGAQNALGVLKFDIQNPYSIYLHSTSLQSAFLNDDRFLSHGCIRLEKPIDLANSLLRGELNVEELKTGKKDTEPVKIDLLKKVQVFITYSPTVVIDSKVVFLPDVYRLFQ